VSLIVLFPSVCSEGLDDFLRAGGRALEQWDKSYTYGPRAPACFVGKDFVKLYDQDEVRLIATARELGVRVVKVDRPGQIHQHIDLVGGPMRKALARAIRLEDLPDAFA
jgi:hypothetical protein